MCGIAGILRTLRVETAPPPELSIPEAWLDVLDEGIRHRGPDGHGRFRDRVVREDGAVVDVALVHRRLAIIDPATGGQPMISERGRDLPAGGAEGLVAVVFNGCIYNHRELRKELDAAGHRFTTDHSDTEVLIHGWREWREKLAERLEGMFAFAVWDRGSGTLFLARDHYGEKPLYVCDTRLCQTDEHLPLEMLDGGDEPLSNDHPLLKNPNQMFAFASSAACLNAISNIVGPTPVAMWRDPVTRAQWTRAWLKEGFAAVSPIGVTAELGPSHARLVGQEAKAEVGSLWCDLDHPSVFAYEPDRLRPLGGARFDQGGFGPRTVPRHAISAIDVDALLRCAVERRLEADVPLGCFLSGGVDSSLVALNAKRAMGQLRTFCVRMPDPRYDESKFAEEAAKVIGTEHVTLECDPRPAEDLVRLISQLGLPFGDSSLLPTYWVSRAAGTVVKVALSGDGGDELFAGYDRHLAALVLRRWSWLLALVPSGLLPRANPKSAWSRLARLADAARNGYGEIRAIFSRPDLVRLAGRRPPGTWAMDLRTVLSPVRPTLAAALTTELAYLSGDLLRKLDTASMAVPLETRCPFLDTELAAAVHAADPRDLIPGGQRKGLLRQVARMHLPPEIVDRPKMGFAIPIGEWFRTDYGGMRQLLMDHLESAEPWGPPDLAIDLNMAFVRRMLGEHMSGRRDHSQRLYMLLVLSIWAKGVAAVGLGAGGGAGRSEAQAGRLCHP
jgi:asparagine synthase (glutamine-hydrolysing)